MSEEAEDNLPGEIVVHLDVWLARRKIRSKDLADRIGVSEQALSMIKTGKIKGVKVSFCLVDPNFIMGSMGSAVGEKIALAAEYAHDNKLPLVIVSGSGGGARMEEGLLSLFQMAKTSAAIRRLQDAGGIYVTVLTNATMGGSMASWASLGDIILAEPQALLGFAGPRVIEQTIKETIPDNFQTADYLLDHGMIDMVVHRKDLKNKIYKILKFFEKKN